MRQSIKRTGASAAAALAAALSLPALAQTAAPTTPVDQFYARVQTVFTTGTQPADLQSLKDDFATSKDSLCTGSAAADACAQKEKPLSSILDDLQSVRDAIAALKVQPNVPAASFRDLDERLKSLTIRLAIPSQEAAAVAAAYMGEVAPALQIQQDIVNSLNSAAGIVNTKPGLGQFLGSINDIQSAVSVGQWGAARDLADHLFDHHNFATGAMQHRPFALLGDMTQKLNPFGNNADNLVQDIKVVQRDLAPMTAPRTAEEFTDRVQSLGRGLDKFAVPIPLTDKESRQVDRARKFQQVASLIINFAGVVPALTALSMLFTAGTSIHIGLAAIGMCPIAGALLWGVGQYMQDRVRGDWKPNPDDGFAPPDTTGTA